MIHSWKYSPHHYINSGKLEWKSDYKDVGISSSTDIGNSRKSLPPLLEKGKGGKEVVVPEPRNWSHIRRDVWRGQDKRDTAITGILSTCGDGDGGSLASHFLLASSLLWVSPMARSSQKPAARDAGNEVFRVSPLWDSGTSLTSLLGAQSGSESSVNGSESNRHNSGTSTKALKFFQNKIRAKNIQQKDNY